MQNQGCATTLEQNDRPVIGHPGLGHASQAEAGDQIKSEAEHGGVAPAAVQYEHFKESTTLLEFGLKGLCEPTEKADSIPEALELLGTHIPLIGHLENVKSVTGQSFVKTAIELGAPPAERLARALAIAKGMVFFPSQLVDSVDTESLQGFIPQAVTNGEAPGVPVSRSEGKILCVIPDVSAIQGMRKLYYNYNASLEFAVSSQPTVEAIFRKKFADTEKPVDDAIASRLPPVVLLHRILTHAASRGASDIHLEPRLTHGVVYIRIDGVRETFRILSLDRGGDTDYMGGRFGGDFGQLVNVIFQQCGEPDLDMTAEGTMETLIPDNLKGRYDFRLHFTKTIYGKRAVIRLLDQSGEVGELDDLNVDYDTQAKLRKIIESDSGLLLFTGPTGSGKSTTQAALLKTINAVQNSIQTIENPVETKSGMWVQHPVSRRDKNKSEADLQKELARGLLRCDPEVMQFQELRDVDNAMVATDAANTGHRVFATLHANSASLAVIRLRSMRSATLSDGIDMGLVSAVLKGVVAQRLVRKVCVKCRVEDEREETYEEVATVLGEVPSLVYRASKKGCDACRHTGHAGRMLVYELLYVDATVAEQIEQGATFAGLSGMIPPELSMRGRGMSRVLSGHTTIDEVRRVASGD